MDGWVTIGTKLDTKDFESELKKTERNLEKFQREEEKLNERQLKINVDLKAYEEEKKLIKEVTNETLTKAQTQKETNSILSIEKIRIDELNTKYGKVLKENEDIGKKISENKLKQKLANQEVDDLRKKLNLAGHIDKVGKSMDGVLKKVTRWGLAIFGIRSAYMFVRQSASTLSQYNEQIGKDLEYIRFALASMIQPVIEGIIKLAYKLLSYVGYIAKAWFGIDLFANASAKAMNKGAKSAEKMKKSLAGFDELNVMNENGTTGAMGGVMPSMNLQAPEDVDAPTWLKWIAENKDIILEVLGGIAGGLLSIHFGLSEIKGLGVGLLIAGVIGLVGDLKDLIEEMGETLDIDKISWETFGKTLTHIGLIVVGLGIIIGNVPVIVAGAIVIILGIIAKFWDKIKSFLSKLSNLLKEKMGYVGQILSAPIDMVIDMLDGLFRGIKQIIKGIIQVCKGDLAGGLKSIFKGIGNIIIGVINAVVSAINAVIYPIRKLIVSAGKIAGKDWTMDNIQIPKIPKLAKGGIVSMPSRGVPVGGAIAGERGREGVIPLTDAQSMQELGQAIGKYININATVPVYVGNKQIAREIRNIQADEDFAFNE